MTSDETLELLTSAVSMRVQGREVPERVRRALAATEATLVRVIGPIVRKRVAARLLGVSVQALDRHIAAGAIPTEIIRAGSDRRGIPTEFVIGLAAERAWHPNNSLASAIATHQLRRRRAIEMTGTWELIRFSSSIEAAMRRKRAS